MSKIIKLISFITILSTCFASDDPERFNGEDGYYVVHIDSDHQAEGTREAFLSAGTSTPNILGMLKRKPMCVKARRCDLKGLKIGAWVIYNVGDIPVGVVYIDGSPDKQKEIHREISPSHQRRGLGTMITKIFYNQVFPEGNIRLQIHIKNYPSIISQYRAGSRVIAFNKINIIFCYKCNQPLLPELDQLVKNMSQPDLASAEKDEAIVRYEEFITPRDSGKAEVGDDDEDSGNNFSFMDLLD